MDRQYTEDFIRYMKERYKMECHHLDIMNDDTLYYYFCTYAEVSVQKMKEELQNAYLRSNESNA